MLFQLLAPLTVLTALVMVPTWALHCGLSRIILPAGEPKSEVGLWDLLLYPMSSVQAKQECTKECRESPTVEATRSLGVEDVLLSLCFTAESAPLCSSLPHQQDEMNISLCYHARQKHMLRDHITTRCTLLTSASPSTSSHLEPVT